MLLEVLLLPFVLLYRRARSAWPVLVYDCDDRLLKRADAPNVPTAKAWTQRMRDAIVAAQFGLTEDGDG